MKKILLTIKNQAKTGDPSRDRNKPYKHDVILQYEDNGLLIVKVDDTPGQWYIGTLLEHGLPEKDQELSIQGNEWYWFNYGASMLKIIKKISEEGLDLKDQLKLYNKRFNGFGVKSNPTLFPLKQYSDYNYYSINSKGEVISGWSYKQDALDDKNESEHEERSGIYEVKKIVHHSRADKEAVKRFNKRNHFKGNKPASEDW